MVSCGSCNRWQHILCHDLFDQRSGRPRRNWDKQQFFCARCRQRTRAYSSQGQAGYGVHPQLQYGWSQTSRPAHPQKPATVDPYAHSSDVRYSHRSPVENGMGYSQQQYMTGVSGASYPRSSYPTSSGLSYSHYQTDQRGLSRAVPEGWSSSNGFAPVADPLLARTPSGHFGSPYGSQNGYSSSRASSVYPVSNVYSIQGLAPADRTADTHPVSLAASVQWLP